MSVAIVDYGSGNLHSAAKAFERAAREAGLDDVIVVTSDPREVAAADRIVLPGVGAFADCRRGLDAVPGMVEALTRSVREEGRPFLGICVGMQLMATPRARTRDDPGLDWIAGDVKPIRPTRPGAEDPPYGLEQPGAAPRRIRFSTASPRAATGCTPISCIPTRSRPNDPTTWWQASITAAR